MVVRFPSEPHGNPAGDADDASLPGLPAGSEVSRLAARAGAGASETEPSDAGSGGRDRDGRVGSTTVPSATEPEPEHLARVTPLRRSASAGSAKRGDRPVAAPRPVAELPFGGETAVREPVDREPAGGEHPAARGSRWNNTWGNEGFTPAETEPADEETERLSRKANAVTIRQLARRGMSRWELEQLLTKRDIAPEVFAPELDRLEALGVIDDASLATTLAFTQHSRKGLGRSAIELDLKRRHIAPELIESALAAIEEDDELERATELATKRIAQLASYDDETARRRLHGFLARKGYDSTVIRQAMDAAFATRRSRGVRFE